MSERILRARIDALNSRIDVADTMIGEDDSALVQTVVETTYPTIAGAFYACIPVGLDGEEREGGLGSFIPDPTRVVYALNLGTQIPPPTTRLVITSVSGRWVFRYDG